MKIHSYSGASISDLLHHIHRRHGDDALIIDTQDRHGTMEIDVAVPEASLSQVHSIDRHVSAPEQGLIERLLKRTLSPREQQSPALLKQNFLQTLRVYCGVIPLMNSVPLHPRFIFEGRPGVGKTTVLLKLATACVLQDIPIHIINLDTAKKESLSALQSFGHYTGITIHQAHDQRSLMTRIQSCPRDHRIVMDTPGWGQDEEAQDHGFLLNDLHAYGFMRCLVHDSLSAVSQSVDMIQTFIKPKDRCMVLTKIDLMRTPETILTLLTYLNGASFIGQSNSPHMTDPIQGLPLNAWADWACDFQKSTAA